MKGYRNNLIYISIVLISLLSLSIKDALCWQMSLKSKVQDEIDKNPFLQKEGIKLRVIEEKNGYLTIEMYEGSGDIRKEIHNGHKISEFNTSSKDKDISQSANALQLTMEALQKIKDVKSILLTAIIGTPRDMSDAFLTEAIELSKNKNYSDAINKGTAAIKLDPTNARAFNNRGSYYNISNNEQEAIKDSNKAIELGFEYMFPYITLGLVYAKQNNVSMACKSLKKAIFLEYSKERLKDNRYDKIRNEPCFQELVKGN